MARTASLVSLVSTVSDHCKNASGEGSASSQHITNKAIYFSLDIYDYAITLITKRAQMKVENSASSH